MDFFEHQERARKSSQRLVLLFALAVAGIVASVYLTVMLFVVIKLNGQLWEPRAFSVIAVAVLAVVGAGSLYKVAQLNGGGAVVARRLGGRHVDPGSTDPLERRVLNVVTLLPHVVELNPEARLPLIEVAAAALATLPHERHEAFARLVRDLVEGDRVLELSEWVLSRLLLRHLRDRLEPRRPPKARYRAISAFTDEAIVLLSALAYAGTDEDAAAERAFKVAADEAGLRGARVYARDACPPRALESALETFALLIPEEKRRLVSACAASVAADGLVTARESELFRVVGDWLGAPVPPLLPGQLLS